MWYTSCYGKQTKNINLILKSMNQKILPIQVQRQILAPLMQKSIAVLLLPIAELSHTIDQEIQANPLLEIDEEQRNLMQSKLNDLQNMLKNMPQKEYDPTNIHDDNLPARPISSSATLEDYLMRQLRIEVSDSLRLKIGEQIIGNLDEDGYLKTSHEEIARTLGLNTTSEIEEIASAIKQFDPRGISSRNLCECLISQIEVLNSEDSALLRKLILEHLDDLGHRRYQDIARKTKLSLDKVKALAEQIATLEPKPARNYRPVSTTIYIKPDVVVERHDEQLKVIANNRGVPPLRISPYYQKLLNRPQLSAEEQTFIQERLQAALNFIKSIKQRSETLTKIVEFIIQRQEEFFNDGTGMLRPLILRDVAEFVERDESTVSRAIRNKYVDTPHGLYPLKFFFSGAISTESNGAIASRSVKEDLAEMITNEDKSSPLSDSDIQKTFQEKGVKLARRTVAKYRKILRILPSHLRKE